MPPRRPLVNLSPVSGFVAALAALGLSPELMARGSQCFLATSDGRMRAWPGLTIQASAQGGTVMMPVSDGYGSLGSVGSPGSGSLAASIADSLWYAGSGPLRFNGAAIGALSASSTLSFLLRSGATYGTTPYQAGRVAPTAPALTKRDNVGGKINGSVAIRATRINSTTGGESDASDPTLPVTIIDGKLLISFNGISLDANGQDKWGLYGTRVGFQSKGPFYGLAKYPEVADASLATLFGVLRAVEVDFTDAELDYERIAPIDNDPPPSCTHVAALENIILAFGVFGGTGVISSKPNFLEAFPIDHLSFLPERPVAVYPRPTQGFILVACRGSVYAVVYTGATPPYALQSVWPETGVAAYHNICFAENTIYAFTERRGICRSQGAGEPDYSFAAEVAEYTSAWVPANVVVGYDVPTQQVVYCHGAEMLPFNKQTGRWGAPLKLSALRSGGAAAPVSGTIKSAVTHQGKLLQSVDTGAIHALYRFGEGGGSQAIYQSPWIPAQHVSETITRIRCAIDGSFGRASTLRIFRNGDAAAIETFNIAAQVGGNRMRYLEALKPGDAKNCESYMLQLTIDSDDGSESLLSALVEGVGSNVSL
ncbi:MAG: hypothetical protein ACR2HX_06185 [Pyrinomonadaceae bacterium]